jgi:hypothetical protein
MTNKKIETKKFGIELPADLKRRIKIRLAQLEMKMKDASIIAFEGWLKTDGGGRTLPESTLASRGPMGIEFVQSGLSLTGEERRWVEAFVELLRSGDQQRINAVLGVLRGMGVENVSPKVPMQSKSARQKRY